MTKYEVLGHLFALAACSPSYRDTPMWRLTEMFVSPVQRDQYLIMVDAEGQPFAAAVWAWLSPEVEARYREQRGILVGDEYASGDRLWFTNIFAPFGGLSRFLARLYEEFPGTTHAHALRDDGRVLALRNRLKEAI